VSNNNDRCVYSWPKNHSEEVRATIGTFRGHRIASLRVYVANEDDELFPTKKGLSLRVADLPRLREAVDALIEAEQAA
jgi:transcriptional coactivator p15 (PC4)